MVDTIIVIYSQDHLNLKFVSLKKVVFVITTLR